MVYLKRNSLLTSTYKLKRGFTQIVYLNNNHLHQTNGPTFEELNYNTKLS